MSNIQFGSEVYSWFMHGTGKAYDNKLDHMIKVAVEAGFTGIEPMVLEVSGSAVGCSTYWLGDYSDPIKLMDTIQPQNMKLAGLALVCAWDAEVQVQEEYAAAWTPSYAAKTNSNLPCSAWLKPQHEAVRTGSSTFQRQQDCVDLALGSPDQFTDQWARSLPITGKLPQTSGWPCNHEQQWNNALEQSLSRESLTIASGVSIRAVAWNQGHNCTSIIDEVKSNGECQNNPQSDLNSPPGFRRHSIPALDTPIDTAHVSVNGGRCFTASWN